MNCKLVCFDVDGTLIDNIVYSWQIFHDHFGISKKIRAKAKQDFFQGRITYEQWAIHDVNLWKDKNASKQDFMDAIRNVKLMNGARETILTIKKKGILLAIVSGSINIILETLIPDYQTLFDEVFLSTLLFNRNGIIEGVRATQYDMDGKADALKKITEKHGIKLQECVFVGDEENDVKICRAAGLGIAFNSGSEKLKQAADVIIHEKDLRKILPYIL